MRLSRVICLLRGDDSDVDAVNTASSLLSGNNRSIHFVHVIEVARRYALDTAVQQEILHAENVLNNAHNQVSEQRGLSVHSAILQSRSIAPVLIREALDFGAQAIVAACVTSAVFAEREIDEDSQYLMAYAPCAVVLVRKSIAEPTRARDTESARRLNARANAR